MEGKGLEGKCTHENDSAVFFVDGNTSRKPVAQMPQGVLRLLFQEINPRIPSGSIPESRWPVETI